MSDIKGLHRNYSEDAVEADEMLKPDRQISPKLSKKNPHRPPRKGSLTRNASQYDMDHHRGNHGSLSTLHFTLSTVSGHAKSEISKLERA